MAIDTHETAHGLKGGISPLVRLNEKGRVFHKRNVIRVRLTIIHSIVFDTFIVTC